MSRQEFSSGENDFQIVDFRLQISVERLPDTFVEFKIWNLKSEISPLLLLRHINLEYVLLMSLSARCRHLPRLPATEKQPQYVSWLLTSRSPAGAWCDRPCSIAT